MVRLLRRHRDLLYMLSRRDITVKYKQSIMGFLWAILMPMLITGAGVVVKLAMASMSSKSVSMVDVLPVAVKSAPWAFFVAAIRFSTQSLSNNYNLVTKIAFPRAVFPLSAVISQLFDFAIAAVVVLAVLVFSPISPTINLLWVPVLIALLVLQVTGLALLLSSANLFFRDVKYLVEVVLTFAIFFTPVFYSAYQFGERGKLLLLNPVAPILEGLDAAIVRGQPPDPFWTAYAAGWALFLMLVTPAIFQRLQPKFAESV
ncbi:MAG TPA: ABC transporter permease [Kofleriaceae bacterium]|nr:ABC transporter permease [Kofleriaceae bacterium]